MEKTKIYGLIGYPVKHSLSPLMHNAAFGALGIDAEYKLFEINPQRLEDFLLSDIEVKDIYGKPVHSGDILGFNVTIPHKVKAKEILEKKFPLNDKKISLEDEYCLKLSGAINTVKRNADKLSYYNTDASGFKRSLEEDLKFNAKGKNALIIGCGGAGRAVIAALSWMNVGINKIYVNDINKEAVDSAKKHFTKFSQLLEDKLEFIPRSDIAKVLKACDLLVNASSVGMKPGDPSIIDKSLLHKDLYVYDVVYNRETQLIKDAKSIVLDEERVKSGLGMLLYQGVNALELWIEKKAPVDIMRGALIKGLNNAR